MMRATRSRCEDYMRESVKLPAGACLTTRLRGRALYELDHFRQASNTVLGWVSCSLGKGRWRETVV